MATDLTKMSEKDLVKLSGEIEKELQGREKNKRTEARKAAEQAAKKHGFSLNDLVATPTKSAKKSAAPAKYKNPANPKETWSGRGRQPVWYKDAMTSGTDPKSMEI